MLSVTVCFSSSVCVLHTHTYTHVPLCASDSALPMSLRVPQIPVSPHRPASLAWNTSPHRPTSAQTMAQRRKSGTFPTRAEGKTTTVQSRGSMPPHVRGLRARGGTRKGPGWFWAAWIQTVLDDVLLTHQREELGGVGLDRPRPVSTV